MSAETCLKHPWLSSILKEDRDLSANKQKMKEVPSSNNNYYFDAMSRTISVASQQEDMNEDGYEWEWEDEDIETQQNTADNSQIHIETQQNTADNSQIHMETQQNTADNSQMQSDAAEIVETPTHEEVLLLPKVHVPQREDALTHESQRAVVEKHAELLKVSKKAEQPAVVITYDQVQTKVAEIQTPAAAMVTKTNPEEPVWQITERVLSPLWDVAKLSSSIVSSAAETSVKFTEQPLVVIHPGNSSSGKKRRSDDCSTTSEVAACESYASFFSAEGKNDI
jgi:hypothetical protein